MFTQGKWELDPSQTGIVQTVISRNESGEVETRCIAQVYIGYRQHIKPHKIIIDRKANAALIAAAPDLLEACKEAQVRIMILDGNNNEAYQSLGKAIAKAETEV